MVSIENSKSNSSYNADQDWDLVLKPTRPILSFQWKEIWQYRDLLMMFVKRDIVTVYKQTILGPLWFFIQPIVTTLIYVIVFAGIAGLSTDGIPGILFYSAGIVVWNYFSEAFTITSKTFAENAALFGKVYFPRIIVPLSKIISGLLKLAIQFLFFLAVLIYYKIGGSNVQPNVYILLVPLLIVLMAMLGLGLGIIFTSLTTKYRDLNFIIVFGVQLLMYATPVIYPMSAIPPAFKRFIMINPITYIVEGFRFAFLGAGTWSWNGLLYTSIFSIVILLFGLVIFNKAEKTFMDTI